MRRCCSNLVRDQSPLGRERLHYFLINKGPWSRLDHNQLVRAGRAAQAGGGELLSGRRDQRRSSSAGFSRSPRRSAHARPGSSRSIRRAGNTFSLLPYNIEYQGELARAAALLREAAQLTTEPTLKAFLTKRADAFLSNDYYDSDVAWMELKGVIEPTIGPYEVYEDELFNYKAAFESYITVQDAAETAKLQKFAAELQDIENHLPIEPKYRNPKIGALAPIVVVNEIYAAGDGNRGVQTAAFNLPNDERVVREKGAKRVMLKNVQDAKFAKTLVPISKVVLSAGRSERPVLRGVLHAHRRPRADARPRAAQPDRQRTPDHGTPGTEGDLQRPGGSEGRHLGPVRHPAHDRQGVMPKSLESSLYTTFLASAFRSIRFGVNEAHGRGIAIQLNSLLDQRGVVVNADGTFKVDPGRIKEGVSGLTRDIMTIQAEGDYAKAKALGERMGVVRPEVQKALDRLASIPVDIEPQFKTADLLLGLVK